jgi:NAD(P)-dependent dehydrogenase (short-subunit alcohol dehydrogenase family)
MKIIIVGATGTIGKNVSNALEGKHEIIKAGSKSGNLNVDITNHNSIEDFFSKTGSFDALVVAAGGGYIGDFKDMTEENFYMGIRSKMMGQINLVLEGKKFINAGGSFTLVSGSLAEKPVRSMSNLSVINAAVNAFAMAAAIELDNGIRINVVSPGPLKGFVDAFTHLLPGVVPVAEERVTAAYLQSIEGGETGKIFKVF